MKAQWELEDELQYQWEYIEAVLSSKVGLTLALAIQAFRLRVVGGPSAHAGAVWLAPISHCIGLSVSHIRCASCHPEAITRLLGQGQS